MEDAGKIAAPRIRGLVGKHRECSFPERTLTDTAAAGTSAGEEAWTGTDRQLGAPRRQP